MCDLPIFCRILRDGHGLCPEGSATLCRHEGRSKESTTKSGCADESHPKDSGGFYGDVTTVCAGFCDVIYGANRNLVRGFHARWLKNYFKRYFCGISHFRGFSAFFSCRSHIGTAKSPSRKSRLIGKKFPFSIPREFRGISRGNPNVDNRQAYDKKLGNILSPRWLLEDVLCYIKGVFLCNCGVSISSSDVSNPKIGRSRVILGYFSFFWGYIRLYSIFRNAKWSQIFCSKRQYMVEAVGKAEK